MRVQENEPRRILESEPFLILLILCCSMLTVIDQMTIMVESSRSFLFTEYARGGCGTFHNQGTDPKVWDVLPVCYLHRRIPFHFTDMGFTQDKFSAYPGIQDILAQVKADKAARKQRHEIYYNDDRLAELIKPIQSQTTNGDIGAETKNSVVESIVPTAEDSGTATIKPMN